MVALTTVFLVLSPQVVQVIPECRGCERTLSEVVRLGDVDGPGAIGHVAAVTALSDARWALTDYQDPRIKIYGESGTYEGHFGRRGQGPGEFLLPSQVWTDRDGNLNVLDLTALRRTIMTASGELVRTVPISVAFNTVAVFSDGSFVTCQPLVADDGSIRLLHVIAPDGHRTGSLGPQVRREARRTADTFRFLAPSGDSAVWVGLLDRYELQLVSLSGDVLRTIRRDTDMFRPHDGKLVAGPDDGPPRPRMVGISERPNGQLWVWLQVPDRDWQSAFVSGTDPYGRPRQVVGDPGEYLDGILEVIDTRTARLVAQARSDMAPLSIVGGGVVAAEAMSAIGVPQVVILRLIEPVGTGDPLSR